MGLQVEIESHSGFCGGVIRAIGRAEKFLDDYPGKRLYSLGDIVHNEAELRRLGDKGLVTVSKSELRNIRSLTSEADTTVLVRAHGEPPETYSLAESLGVTVIDCTCPVVLRLQKSIREAYERLRPAGGQLVIFGKIGHAEVLGLLGQVGGDAEVIEDIPMLLSRINDGAILTDKPLEVFSQTTKSPVEYAGICSTLSSRCKGGLRIHETICSQVASRHEELAGFASGHDVIVFVSGMSSSNGKVLFDLCKARNRRAYHISETSGLSAGWFSDGDKVGVCGATSTPGWLLAEVAEAISRLSVR